MHDGSLYVMAVPQNSLAGVCSDRIGVAVIGSFWCRSGKLALSGCAI